MKYWEIIADNLSKAGWSWGCVSAVDRDGGTISIADAHRDDGKRFVARADEKLTAFLELESAIHAFGELTRQAGGIFVARVSIVASRERNRSYFRGNGRWSVQSMPVL